ncbi:MAG: phBC6A51 family helix-turn-helix protein [Candidatus Paceibacterota bacterium]
MSTNLPANWKPSKAQALEIMIEQPSRPVKQVAEDVGVANSTLHLWLKDPEFVEVFYQRYMVTFGAKLPAVLNSMIQEAEAGNVSAGRLVLEHSGKLIKRVEVANTQSPFEKFLDQTEEVEAIEVDYEDYDDLIVMPERPVVKPKKVRKTKAEEERELKAKQERLKKRAEARKWRIRAEKVGLPPSKRGRQTNLQRRAWKQKIVQLEKERKEND